MGHDISYSIVCTTGCPLIKLLDLIRKAGLGRYCSFSSIEGIRSITVDKANEKKLLAIFMKNGIEHTKEEEFKW